MIAIPGDTPAETIAAIIADEAAIGVVNNKTTAVRIIPAVGKKVGDRLCSAASWAKPRSCRSMAWAGTVHRAARRPDPGAARQSAQLSV